MKGRNKPTRAKKKQSFCACGKIKAPGKDRCQTCKHEQRGKVIAALLAPKVDKD